MGKNGSLSYLFERKGVFTIKKGDVDPEEFELEIIDAGLDSLEVVDDKMIVSTAMEDFGSMQKQLDSMGIEIENAELQRIPNVNKTVDVDIAKKALKMLEQFEDDDDVQNVYHDIEMTDELEKALSEE